MKTLKRISLPDNLRSEAIRYIAALLCIAAVGAALISAQGVNPAQAFGTIIKSAFGTKAGFGSTLRYMMPCMMLAIAGAVAFKSGVWNLGVIGQMYFGSLVAALLGYMISLPAGIHTLVCILAGGIAGVLWGLIPALAKMLFNVSEMVVTMMTNYVALLFTAYLVQWVILGRTVSSTAAIQTQTVLPTARLPVLIKGTTASTGLFIAFAIVIAAYILFNHTVLGYELKQVGENIKFSKVGGINVAKTFLLIFIISSFISGVVGSVEILGPYGRFTPNYAGNLPFEGLMISFISKHKPLAIIVVSFLWGALRAGALSMERALSVNVMTVYVLQMLFVLFVSFDFPMIGQKLKGLITMFKKTARS